MSAIWLTVFVCALSGSPCKNAMPEAASFSSFEECQDAGARYQLAWLARHRDWQDGGVICSVRKSKP